MQPSAPYTVTETLYESEGTSLYRALGPDRVPVILKVLDPRRCRPKALDRQRSEYEFGRTLDLPAIARPLALETYQGMPALVIEDFGGKPLDVLVGEPLPVGDGGFSESACLAAFARASFGAGIALRHILKQVVAFLYGRYDEALEAAARHASAPGPVSAFLYDATHHLFRALTAAALHARAQSHEQQELARILAEELQRHARWAQSCPENFLHRHALISAEVARIEGRELDAERRYEQAIRSAHDNGFIQHEAIALELASKFHRARGFELVADTYLREARARYAQWGAAGKVKEIDGQHPRLLKPRPVAASATFVARTEQLDLLSVAKGAQMISGEIVLDELLRTLLQVVLEQSGAQRGCLLLARAADPAPGSERALSLAAEATFDEEGLRATLRTAPLDGASTRVPVSIVQYVLRTKELSNSMKFGAGKPVEVAIGAERGLARLVVRDRGIGIQLGLQARIFDRFERAVSSEHYGGLGLGLYISRRIVEAHGGSIRVESEPEAGSTFTVELPCAGPPQAREQGLWREPS